MTRRQAVLSLTEQSTCFFFICNNCYHSTALSSRGTAPGTTNSSHQENKRLDIQSEICRSGYSPLFRQSVFLAQRGCVTSAAVQQATSPPCLAPTAGWSSVYERVCALPDCELSHWLLLQRGSQTEHAPT